MAISLVAARITNEPKCKCNFESENVNHVGGASTVSSSRTLKLIKKMFTKATTTIIPQHTDDNLKVNRYRVLFFIA